jgi:hypothetical protein
VDTPQIPRHGPFRDLEAQFQKFSVDFGSTLTGILFRHPADERPDFSGDLGPTALRPGPPSANRAGNRCDASRRPFPVS